MKQDFGVDPTAKDEYLFCRTFLHAWESSAPPLTFTGTGTHHLFLVCTRCGTEKVQDLDTDGTLWGSHYSRTPGYQAFLKQEDGGKASRADLRREVNRRQEKARKGRKP